MANPLADKHPDSEGFSCDGEARSYNEHSRPDLPFGHFKACPDCGAFFENGDLTGHNETAALDLFANADDPSTARHLATDNESGTLSLWLLDRADNPADSILAIRTTSGQEVAGTGSELRAMARAILNHLEA